MQQVNEQLPIPIFLIDKNLQILGCSPEAEEQFNVNFSLLDVIEGESRDKVKQQVHPDQGKRKLEINVINQKEQVLLADLYAGWESELHGKVFIQIKEESISRVTDMLAELRTRLQDTNFELLKEKEKLEQALIENDRLSAPFIEVTEDLALIPLYGEVHEDKMNIIREKILTASFERPVTNLLFDFTAIGEIKGEGLLVLKNMFQSLTYMGKKVVITGVTPKQAKRLHELDVHLNITFIQSLEAAVKKESKS
ncbi:STAS domain-containing protein [Thalassorhabdus alkalitolerans]|uniref:STAS domain-containing protein n=1 Tax=Thalassorhabdus alkalitolerans TaxID=2282697 RepID=A0ABW0YMA1_9BACI